MTPAPRLVLQDRRIGRALCRPECVLALADGRCVVSDRRGLVTEIAPDGGQRLRGRAHGLPNGIAMDAHADLLVADIGGRRLVRLAADGDDELELPLTAEGGDPGAVNFVLAGPDGALWISVSTTRPTLREAIDRPAPDGLLLRLDEQGVAVVADGLWFANEIRFDAAGEWLYVVETTRGRLRRARVEGRGRLGALRPFGPDPLYEGAWPDGLAFDAAGRLWVTELARNALIVLGRDGDAVLACEDPAGDWLDKPTSLAFAGEDLRTLVVGSLKATSLAVFRSDVPGLPLGHWHAAPGSPAAEAQRQDWRQR